MIVGYKGLIDLARRSGQIVSIAAHEVCEEDEFDMIYGLDEKLEHRPAMKDRGAIIGFYAVAKLTGGGHAFEFMSRQEVDAIMHASQSKGNYGPWKDHYTEMGRKTVIRRLSKYLPLSIEFQAAAALDDMASRGQDQRLDDNTIDGEFAFIGSGDEFGSAETVDQETGEVTSAQQGGQQALGYDYNELLSQIQKCKSADALDLIGDSLRDLPENDDRTKLEAAYSDRRTALSKE